MNIEDKIYEYYRFYKKINKLHFIKYKIEVDKTTYEATDIIFEQKSLEYIKTKVNVDEFIEFLILYFNTILKKYDKNNEKS